MRCPKCGTDMQEPFVALSRDDNQTNVCPDCGTTEALLAFLQNKGRNL
tara:strand:- start:3707 stop:3850 length:144 start_codon:yes stop_codon:yes gene_type:complete